MLQLVEDSPLLSSAGEGRARRRPPPRARGRKRGRNEKSHGTREGSASSSSSSMGDMLSMGRGGILGGGGSRRRRRRRKRRRVRRRFLLRRRRVSSPGVRGRRLGGFHRTSPDTSTRRPRRPETAETLFARLSRCPFVTRTATSRLSAPGRARVRTCVGKEFLIAVRVERHRSQFIKKTADDAGLRALPGLYLVSIERPRAEAGDSEGSGVVTATGVRETAFAPVAGTVATAADPSAAAPVPTDVLTASAWEIWSRRVRG